MKILPQYFSVYRIRINILLVILLFFQLQVRSKFTPLKPSSAFLIEGPDHVSIIGDNINGFFGVSISNIGDFNGDGRVDFTVIGATAGLNILYVFFGPNQPIDSMNALDANISFVEENVGNFDIAPNSRTKWSSRDII